MIKSHVIKWRPVLLGWLQGTWQCATWASYGYLLAWCILHLRLTVR